MSDRLYVVAPSDKQLDYIRYLCHRDGLPLPDCVASMQEAGAIIDAIKAGTYRYEDYEWPWGVPFR